MTLTPVLSASWDTDRSWQLDAYRDTGGYDALRTALSLGPDEIIN